jgi:hypothetical protein
MQSRTKSDAASLGQYNQSMWGFSSYMLSRPTDSAADGTANVGTFGTARPFETVGLAITDIESSLRSLDVPLGKYGHMPQVIRNTHMVPAGQNALGPMTKVPRLTDPARDVRSAPGRPDPAPPVPNPMPVYAPAVLGGTSSRLHIKDNFSYPV